MPVDRARLKSRVFDRQRARSGPSGSLKILSGSQHEIIEATYTAGWRFPRDVYDDLAAGKKFRKLEIADTDGTRKAKLIAMTAIQVDSVIYKNPSKDPNLFFSGGLSVYEFKVSPTGERV